MDTMITASDIALYLNSPLIGDDFDVSKVTSLDQASEGALVFSKSKSFKITANLQCLVLCPEHTELTNVSYSYIRIANPRLAFAKAVGRFFAKKPKHGVHASSVIGNNCCIHPSVSIGAHCVIGDGVCIGENSIINNNVVLYDNTIIGSDCYIKSGAIIGEDGFGFGFEEDEKPVRIPHLGNVIIGNNVEIGAHSSIARGTLGSTKIGDSVKIDDQVFIAHNCIVGNNTMIIACAEICGSVRIGKNCWIGPNCSINNQIVIGDNVTIGIGAVVTSNVDSLKKIMGLESLELRRLITLKKRIEFGT